MYAFLAVVAHYTNNSGELGASLIFLQLKISVETFKISPEELLIDFRELIGEHTGENMAEAVWETLAMYGIQDRVSCIWDPQQFN